MKNSNEMKQKCGWDAHDVVNEAELQASAFGDHVVQIDINGETTTITFEDDISLARGMYSSFGDHVVQIDTDDETTTIIFEDGSIVFVRYSDVEYL